MSNIQGWLNIYKPLNISSFAIIRRIKKKFNIDKIGHGGTLDPLAEGILPIAVGKTTKLIPFINSDVKEYEFEIKWGEQTSTDDREGKIIERTDNIPTLENIKIKLKEFRGIIMQKPPKASAIKIKGQRAYNLLRQNIDFEVGEKNVQIFETKIINWENELITKIKIKCGKGFYVRSFARDLAEKLDSKGHVHSLKRTKVGKFNINNANLLDDLLKIGQRLHEFRGFHSSVSMLDDILAYEVDDEESKLNLSHGKEINININLLNNPPLNLLDRKVIFLTNKGSVLSFGKLDGDLFKPDKVLI
ncbi:MAG: tRNA pseudouridine synthase B [Alphaproteobacteria bacterium MarineAlpha5_Bin2]|jgi:tRNA pseudouridine55 synthase|nr:MAG: tRNA pseudouridine synthase B [Alphaproteobacteria bacterium MarineAlpha5_Bin2]HIA60938.1 tRNA pseudouridine(55) synthase TruB [Pelagibacterales bacterium]|tara:strand:- start:720 stop:1628 length:909 start_codon:yes stop_codon:yes gene_type:complete